MSKKINIGFAGFSNTAKGYRTAIDKVDNLTFAGAYFFSNEDMPQNYDEKVFNTFEDLLTSVDAVCFFGEHVQTKYISDAIRALKNIFIDDYSCLLSNKIISQLCRLADEADVVTQVSMPKMYYWNIGEIVSTYKNIRNISFDKTIDYSYQRTTADIYPEIIALTKIADSEVVVAHCKTTPLVARKSELLQVDIEFLNGITASIKANPCGFYDNHELMVVAENNLALIDLRKREWHNLLYKSASAEPAKEMFNLDEVPFVERDEMFDFAEAINKKTEPMVTLKSIRTLCKCIEMIDAE